MIENSSKYLKFIDEALELVKNVPRYFSRYSNKLYCNHQKIILIVLKQKLRTTYRELIELLKISYIPLYIGLKRIPHHTTLVKFSKKIKLNLLNILLPYRKTHILGIDATGFGVENRSAHYQMRTALSSYRKYIKLSISADLQKQVIFRCAIHKSPRHDSKDFIDVIDNVEANIVCADKGYDANKYHKYVIRDLRAKSLIRVKKHTGRCRVRANQKYRKKARREFNELLYHQRSKIESIFSSIKRKYGSCLRAKSFAAQQKEVICKLIAYNIDRLVILYKLLFVGFQQSRLTKAQH